jgi:hypothetical protein
MLFLGCTKEKEANVFIPGTPVYGPSNPVVNHPLPLKIPDALCGKYLLSGSCNGYQVSSGPPPLNGPIYNDTLTISKNNDSILIQGCSVYQLIP